MNKRKTMPNGMRAGVAIAAALLAGCGPLPESPQQTTVDQCMRADMYFGCLRTVPPHPESARDADMPEVLGECAKFSYSVSTRQKRFVKPECLSE